MIIGITGGTGCGKTTLLSIIRDHGGLILDCDAIYHNLLKTNAQLLRAIEARFPGTVEDGLLNRKKLGSIVFADADALLDLNRITHSAVRDEVIRHLEYAPRVAAIDAIALFEGGLASLCDVTVAVTAPEEARIARLMAREGISEAYAAARIAAQKPQSWFAGQCDHTLENSDKIDAFATKGLAFFTSLAIIEKNQ